MSPLLKVVVPLVVLITTLLISRARHVSFVTDLGLVRPPLLPLLGWLLLALVWMLASDSVLHWRGTFDFHPWQAQPLWVSIARVLGVGILGPVAEELVVRGMVFARLRSAGLPVVIVILLTAAGWSLLHLDYTPAVILIIFIEGLLLGSARQYTGSLLVPILLHIAWNFYAVW
ncbi:CPBP family intramembrane glutamic endopeptidase [Hymenobacter crusticola]|nr:CPBP family intramembrane glutamic endopeptidase [Hymenobacter crusticola]